MLGLKAKKKHLFTLFLPKNYLLCKEGGAGSTCHLSSDVLPTLAPHQPYLQQSLPKGLRAACLALQWGRGWAREPTHDITVDLSSGRVIMLTTGLFTMGKGDLLFGGNRGHGDIFCHG